ncbi:MarR family winged helix-turn-helix transcriptional regulator [Falsiroseomonas oryziterrae]|uniref:MarR family winged helix-turn-helix transcriptional regulator n=1 Tax=Falsiroseomonas oryziterrae TaxID=2911368 RepID=UPI001F28E0B1|nr:MarR family winged helix-turn-helix transcriptional regulator [Roseomonas sp. NPKOSM-4]
MTAVFDSLSDPLPRRLAAGLSRLSVALRAGQWRLAEAHGLTPTQAQALALLAARSGAARPALRVSDIAEHLAITRPTASDAVTALERKGLIRRQPDPRDARATGLVLTEAGTALAREAGDWPATLLDVAADLPPPEQEALLRLVTKLIRGLQLRGAIAPARMCATCRFFRPYAHPADAATPHHCSFVDAPFGDRHLRLDCAEQDPLPDDEAEVVWTRFVSGPPAATPP